MVSGTSNIINITVNHTGKEDAGELGNKVGIEVMKAIAKQEASKQVYLYDKGNKANARRSA